MLFIERLIMALLLIKVSQSLTVYQPNPKKYIRFAEDTATQPFKQGSTLNCQQKRANRWTAMCPKQDSNANEQPAAAGSLESEISYKAQKRFEKKPLFFNYHNQIYHISNIKRPNPVVRKQRSFKENHDDKLIEQRIEEIKNVNEDYDQQNSKAAAALLKQPLKESSHEIRYLHDIFLNYPKPHQVNFGHIQLSPLLFEKHFESQKGGNRYKGEIMWLDKTGGFAQHYWDLAQGRL